MAKRIYTEAEIERGLSVLALCAGHGKRAEEMLREDGHPIPASTLLTWTRTKPERYAKAQRRVYHQLQSRMAGELERLSARAISIEDKLLDRIERETEEIPARDLAGALRNVATAQGISTDKFRLLRDQPAAVVEHRNADEILNKWRAAGLIVEGTVEEPSALPTAQGSGVAADD